MKCIDYLVIGTSNPLCSTQYRLSMSQTYIILLTLNTKLFNISKSFHDLYIFYYKN